MKISALHQWNPQLHKHCTFGPRRTRAKIPGEWESTGGLLHLGWLFPKTVVTLVLHLGPHCTTVQDFDGKQYVVAERDQPWQGEPHAVLLQTSNHCTICMPVQKGISPVAATTTQSAPSLMPTNKTPASLYGLLGVGKTPKWPKTDLDKLLQAVCARFAVVQKDDRCKHRCSH